MKITVFGAGYVGIVSAACLVRDGHHVTFVEPVGSKVDDLNRGRSPIREPGVAPLLDAGRREKRLRATTDPTDGLRGAEMVWVCVGTPSGRHGEIDLTSVRSAVREIGDHLRRSADRPLIAIRSTVLPGTTAGQLRPELEEASGLHVGSEVHLVFHPEFLREGTAVDDFDNPPKIVVGADPVEAGEPVMGLYANDHVPQFRLSQTEAEMVKYCDNLFHAVKITFANEMGALCHHLKLDARRIADVFCSDTKLNISGRYLRPGFAFGGSCLPKDLRAILRHAAQQSLELPMLEGVPRSNARQIDSFVDRILERDPRRVGMVGLAFKINTDDMRESPYVRVAKRLIGEGIQLRIYDPGIDPQRLVGSNQKAVQAALGHLEPLLASCLDELDASDAIIINHPTVETARVHQWLDQGIHIIDLANIGQIDRWRGNYEGIAW